ncbi:hypothetical protein ElyMa_005165600 [Elysia marginata]|uniref:Uncharacterized protein n=1 Tax=Elysia marginata TaxID=1093978 RepID=A0AAV4JPY2_9GAST|nr:hypothetical protein ElyMa_005165600 [Elysia marginata]
MASANRICVFLPSTQCRSNLQFECSKPSDTYHRKRLYRLLVIKHTYACFRQSRDKQGHAKLLEKVNTAPPDQELGPKKPESKFENANAACVSSRLKLNFRARSRSRSSSKTSRSSSKSSADGQVTSDRVETVSKKENHSAPSNYLPCDKVQLQIINMNEATRNKIAQPERNNTFKKLLLDTFEDTCSMVAETEDLIVEYCIRKEQIINFFMIEDKEMSVFFSFQLVREENVS